MKKKVFSLMMTLLLAFMGVAKADVVELGGESTSTSSYLPNYEFYNYSLTQQIYTADEIGTAGTINSIAFYTAGSATRTLQVYLVHTSLSAFGSTTAWVVPTAADMVYSGSVSYTSGGWTTITLSTPFEYNGTDNLCLIVDDNTGGYVSSVSKYVYDASGNQALRIYSDGTNYNALAPTSYSGTQMTQKNCIKIDITPAGGAGMADRLHVKYMDGDVEIVDSLNMGVRPVGAWMEPFTFTMYSEGPTYTINVLDFTPSDGMFTVEGEELPFQVSSNNPVELTMATNATEAGVVERQFVAITEGNRAAHIWPVVVEMYAPAIPDVWEKACTEATTFPFVEVPATAHNTTLHNDYTLPFPEIPEGYDAVYKLVFDHDVMLNAEVTSGNDGKVALYKEDFNGEPGPMGDNYYQGPTSSAGGSANGGLTGGQGGGGVVGGGFEAMIGDPNSTSTSTYFPFHTLWNYSLAENLFLASELTEAGVTTAPMTSLSWYVSSTTCTTPQNGISIWMANVSDTELTTTSHLTSGMTLVYTGDNVLPVAGQWNEFVFNGSSFAWDGHSSILIVCQRLNGDWQGSVSWQTHNPGFTAMAYDYDDYEVYNAASQTYSMYTSATNRQNIIMKSARGNREGNREMVQIGDGTQTYYYYPVNTYFNYSLTEQIYTADEIGTAGTINSISFYYDYTSSFSMANVSLYMKNVTRDEFTNTSDMEPLSLSDIVWTGTLSASAPGWITINLDSPFYYDGTSNLLVAGFDGTSDYPGSSYKFRTTECTGYKGLAWYSDTYTPNPYNVGSWSGSTIRTQYRNNIQLDITTGGGGNTPANIAYGPVITDAPVEAGTYYLVASSTTPDFEVTINAETMPCPDEAFAFSPTPADDADGIEPASVTLRWMVPPYATGWRLVFGSTYYPDPNHPQTVLYPADGSFSNELANSFTITNLWNNTNYFWHVEFNNDGCPDGTSSPIWGFTTHLNIPTNLQASDYTIFNDETVTLTWNSVVDRTYRQYFIYRDGVKIGETQVNNPNATTYTDGPLAYNMDGYTYYVTAIYDEGESAPSDPVTVKVSGYGDVNGHVYEQDGTTGIANATVTMVGQDEFGDPHTYTFTTDGQGSYSGHIYVGTYNGQATCNGYQGPVDPVQGNPIAINYNETTSPIDYIMDENFDGPCTVIAEYYPDSLDPNSPYVKVYWGCGLPGSEIVEPFETGDFSLFDWQLDPTYPWTITTNNPYEGTYCMKSGGAGVANVVSNMTVTVEIPADGVMSFFGKISCENNWDYGYFYIDGVQKGNYTGAGQWGEKVFDITAGTHTFQWRYTKDSSVNSNDDCFYVDYVTFYRQPEPAIPGMTYDFENSTMQGWTSVDADGDGRGWYVASEIMSTGYGHDGSNDCVLSQSYDNNSGVLYPDNYLVSPQVQLGGIVRFYACAQDANYAAEHFGVAVSTTNTQPGSFTMVQEWTMSAKAADGGKPVEKNTRSGRAQGNWYEYTIDLSAYSGMGYVAIRHFNCSDMFYLDVDDITIGEPGKGLAENRSLTHYRVYRTNCYNDGPYTEENTVLLATNWPADTVYIDVEWADLEPGVYKWGVGAVYAGNRGEMIEGGINWSEPVNVRGDRAEFTYGFEGGLDGWTVIDVNAGQGTWIHSDDNLGGYDYTTLAHGGTGFAMCYSYVDYVGAYDTDSYLVSPQKYSIDANSSLHFWADNANDSYPESFSVCVATAANPTAADFTQVWGGSAKGNNGQKANVRHDGNRYENWREHTIDLSAYAGQEVWIAFHDVNYDQYEIWIDDVTITAGNGGGGGNTGGNTNNLNQLALERESETVWSNCLDKDMWLNGVNVTVLLNSADSPEGTTVSFTNLNEYEQQNYAIDQLTLDESGYYEFESFRRGDYAIEVRHEGYEPIFDTVSIWEPTELRYVMIEILYGVGDIYVSRTGWAMWGEIPSGGGTGGGGGQGGNGDTFNVDFEDGQMPAGWTTVDANNDGYDWVLGSQIGGVYLVSGASLQGSGHNSSNDLICSGSYSNASSQAITPDNYLVSPRVNLVNGSTFSFWACAQDASYAAEHFGVFVSDNGTSDWTEVQSWTMTAKDGGNAMSIGRNGELRAQGNWYQKTVDLSAYAGQKYIAIRHFGCNDQFILDIDDIELSAGAKDGDRHFQYYKVMCTSIDGVPIYNHNTPNPFCQLSTNEPFNAPLVEGEHYLCKVAAVYSTGMSAWSEPVEWQYEPCDHWGPVDEVNVDVNNAGNHIEWTFEHGFNPYDPGTGAKAAEFAAPTIYSGMQSNGTYVINIADIANYDERVYFLSNLTKDARFDVVAGEAGSFIVSANDAFVDLDLEEAIVDFSMNNANEFAMMDKVQAAETAKALKATLPNGFANAMMMDIYVKSRENNMCALADPFCTDNGMYEFPAGVNAGSGETGPDYDCLYTTPNPAWYYMRIGNPGGMDIYMYSTPSVDIDFCCWGPFDDPTTPCPYGLTEDKVVSCSYSSDWEEDCIIPDNAQTGEYYILVITNYSNQACNINFSAVSGAGSTDCGILPPVDIIGFLITMDGEYLAFAGPTDRDYIHEGEFGAHEYCVRPIYPGEMTLPANNFGWSMGCPVCEGGQGGDACEAGAPIHGEALNETDQVKIWWGEQEPGPGCEGDEFTLNFDDSQMPAGWTTHDEDGDGFNWVLGTACDGIYLSGGNLGGAGHNASADLIVSGSYSNVYGALTPDNWLISPVVTLCEGSTFSFWACGQDASYVAEHFGVAVSEDGGNSFTMVQEWTMTAKGEGNTSIGRDGQTRAQGTWHQYTVDLSDYAGEGRKIAIRHFNCTDMFILDVDDIQLTNGAKGMRAGIVSYNVYRSTENANYTLIGNVPAVAGQNYYEYIDTPTTAGTYYYQVTAVYENCESEPAVAAENENQDYVVVSMDGIVDNLNEVAIYPNPTKSNLTIEAKGMNRITVVSVLGQVVYDAEVDADHVILNMAQFNAGMYTVRVATADGVTVRRVTVIR